MESGNSTTALLIRGTDISTVVQRGLEFASAVTIKVNKQRRSKKLCHKVLNRPKNIKEGKV